MLLCAVISSSAAAKLVFRLKIMDAYHQVLARLYEVTDGKDTKSVDFKELVRSLGFHGNYPDIFERLSRDGWIAEDKKADFVRITHWGVLEAKKSPAPLFDQSERNLTADAGKALVEVKELSLLMEIFTRNTSRDNLTAVEKKIEGLMTLINQIKANIAE